MAEVDSERVLGGVADQCEQLPDVVVAVTPAASLGYGVVKQATYALDAACLEALQDGVSAAVAGRVTRGYVAGRPIATSS